MTGRSFGEIVEDVRFDAAALYEQTAPAATASELASRFRRMPSVRVAMMNVSANAYNGTTLTRDEGSRSTSWHRRAPTASGRLWH